MADETGSAGTLPAKPAEKKRAAFVETVAESIGAVVAKAEAEGHGARWTARAVADAILSEVSHGHLPENVEGVNQRVLEQLGPATAAQG